MATRVVFTPEARAQLMSLYRYVADQAGPDTAFALTSAIVDHCERFTTFPRRGTPRDDIRPGLRTLGFLKRAVIAFDVAGDTITIIGIFYGGQDFETALSTDDG